MDSLIPVISKLQDVFATVGAHEDQIQLPQIAVVGCQSTGKSSVIEGIVGRDFLPRGNGIVTRRPLFIHLNHTPLDDPKRQLDNRCENSDWVTFDHWGDEIFDDFEAVRGEIAAETERVTGTNKGISNIPIIMKMFSSKVVTLSLVDLPGITKVPVGDQPADIENQIRDMVLKYINNPNCIILAVTPANQDFATSESLKLARKVDKNGDRTLCVLTKLDLMDKGTDAMEVLTGSVIPVKLGIIGTVNRSQADINNNKTIEECLKDESEFLRKKYPTVADYNGIPFLARSLNKILMQHICDCLPDLKRRVNKLITDNKAVLSSCGKPVIDKQKALLDIIKNFSLAYTSAIEGNSKKLEVEELRGGACIAHIFHFVFHRILEEIDPTGGLTPREILTAIHNASGPRAPLFIPQNSFELLVKEQISTMKEPSLKCVDFVHVELKRIVTHCGAETSFEKKRFPRVYDRINDIVSNLLNSRILLTKESVEDLIDMQLAYINTKHPEFDQDESDEDNDLAYLPKLPNGIAHEDEEEDDDDSLNHSMELMDINDLDATEGFRKSRFAVLTEKEKNEAGDVEKMVTRYFNITRKSIEDMVPKAVMKNLVNYVRDELHTELLQKLYNAKDIDIDELLAENKFMALQRKQTTEMLQALNKANDVISEIRDISFL